MNCFRLSLSAKILLSKAIVAFTAIMFGLINEPILSFSAGGKLCPEPIIKIDKLMFVSSDN